MSKRLTTITGIVMAVATAGCIRNDVPYPIIPQYILTLAADGQTGETAIDNNAQTAVLAVDESSDIRAIRFNGYTYSDGATSSPDLLDGTYDMTQPLKVTLSRYQSYEWTVTVTQDIERYFTIEGQVGATVIDVPGRRVIVRVPSTADTSKLTLLTAKLGPAGVSTTTPGLLPGTIDLSHPLEVTVTAFGRSETWTIYAEITEATVQTTAADAWSQVIWAYGEAPADAEAGFEYRVAGAAEWTRVPDEYVTRDGGSLTARIPHLTPLTGYEVRAVSGDDTGTVIAVTTQATADIPDGSFDQWWLNGRIWCPWNEGGQQYWDTGNTGAATLGQSNVQPSDFTPTGSGKSAMLETRFVGIGVLGKLAAGSIYTGLFKRVDGTNGILDFGRKWTLRPTKLRGYFSYTTAAINYADADHQDLIGKPDACHIYVALADWTAPYEIRTNPRNRQVFDPDMPSIIAYGELVRDTSTDGYQEFEITLDYRSTSRVPTYLQITCAASKYGDFFTGGTGTVLYVDQLSFDYDY